MRMMHPERSISPIHKLAILLSGFLSQFGWAFFGFGSLFVIIFCFEADYSGLFGLSHLSSRVQGTVTEVEATNARQNKRTVFAYHYTFEESGKAYCGVSYEEGKRFDAPQAAEIMYSPLDPTRSRIVGMRSAKFGAGVAFCLLIPLIGLVFILVSIPGKLRGIRLLSRGVSVTAEYSGRERTSMKINGRSVFKYSFTFTAQDGLSYETSYYTHRSVNFDSENSAEVLYLPDRPSISLPIRGFPVMLEKHPSGGYSIRGISVWPFILPGLVLCELLYMLTRLG